MSPQAQLAALASLVGSGKLTEWEEQVFLPQMQARGQLLTNRQLRMIAVLFASAHQR